MLNKLIPGGAPSVSVTVETPVGMTWRITIHGATALSAIHAVGRLQGEKTLYPYGG